MKFEDLKEYGNESAVKVRTLLYYEQFSYPFQCYGCWYVVAILQCSFLRNNIEFATNSYETWKRLKLT